MYQKVSEAKLQSIYRTIAKQAPHQLKKLFVEHTGPIKRFSVLNKEKLVDRSGKLMGDTD
jgi:hypothetical protein